MKLNLCCGKDYREGYVNVDFSSLASDGEPIEVDLKLDLLNEKWPWEEGSVDEIVFRESLEHFNRWNGLKVLKNIFYILKPGGVLDLTVPPSAKQLKILMAFMTRPASFDDFENAHSKPFNFWKAHDDLMGATHESDGMDGDSHKTLFSRQSLVSILENVGFKILSSDDNIHIKATK